MDTGRPGTRVHDQARSLWTSSEQMNSVVGAPDDKVDERFRSYSSSEAWAIVAVSLSVAALVGGSTYLEAVWVIVSAWIPGDAATWVTVVLVSIIPLVLVRRVLDLQKEHQRNWLYRLPDPRSC